MQDVHGHPLSGATAAALDHYEQARADFLCYVGDPLGAAQKAIAAAPEMTMAHVLIGWLVLSSTEAPALPLAREAHDAACRLPADRREAMHVKALGELLENRWFDASRTLEDLSVEFPHDLLALQAGHQIDFFTGQARMLRDRIARALPAWQPGMPGYHALLSMHAFGLEEMGDYPCAERYGRQSVEIEPRDGWGWHAVAHVMEMQNRRREGVQWLGRHSKTWSDGSFFAGHNWWHLGLFHLGLDQIDEVLAITDERVLGPQSPVVLDMIDASAMLWRLQLRGIDVGNRWAALAERWVPQMATSHYAFNDAHAMMAFLGAGRDADVRALLQAQEAALRAPTGDQPMFLREVGHDVAHGLFAFAQGRHGEAVTRLRRVRNQAHRYGGSHAQRDLIDLTLIEAARLDGQTALAAALANERVARH